MPELDWIARPSSDAYSDLVPYDDLEMRLSDVVKPPRVEAKLVIGISGDLI